VNERLACLFGNHLIADHPEIARHLARLVSRRKITTIPYGADEIREADLEPLFHLDLRPKQYALLVARPEPENSILEIVSGFSARRRGYELAVLGHYNAKANPYHARVLEAAGPEVVFVGPVYDKSALASLRLHARLYVHGHTVGGTNPALVEALGAGCPVLAHDNRFNRWVAGSEARYFRDARECDEQLTSLLDDPRQLALMSAASRQRHAEAFTWDRVLSAYEQLLTQYAAGKPVVPAPAKVSATEVIDAALEPVGYL
jgi:glycosyltransferase involved in cell wall biosynthesis